jgi:hypothetical protein
MNSLFNLIKNLFSGVVSFVGGIFSKKPQELSAAGQPQPRKRSSGYFLEYEDANSSGTASDKTTTEATQTAKPIAKADPKPTATKSQPAAKVEPATAVQAETLVATKSKTEPQPIANALNLPQPTVTTFAPNYLTPTNSNRRRRPGANMAAYMDMARQVRPQE